MKQSILSVAALLLLSLIATSRVKAQDGMQVGAKVITKYKTPLRVGNQVVDSGSQFQVYKVERVDGDWLWLVSGASSGWVASSQVVPYHQALDYYTQQIQIDPSVANKAHAYVCRGAIHAEKGQNDAALADDTEALKLSPKYVSALNNRGALWLDKGKQDTAIADLTEALRLNPKYVAAFYNRALAWTQNKEYVRAVSDLSEALRLNPNLVNAYYQRGNALLMTGKYDEAIADFDMFIKTNPSSPKAFANRASAWRCKSRYFKAVTDFTEAIRLDPKEDIYLYKRGMCSLESGDDDHAIDDFTEVVRREIKGGKIVAGLARGTAWGHKRDYQKAIDDFTEVTRLNPNDPTAYNNLAFIRATCPDARFRDGPKALAFAKKVCEGASTENDTFLSTLGAAYAELGDFPKAIESQEKANKLLTSEREKQDGEERLEFYKNRRPYRG